MRLTVYRVEVALYHGEVLRAVWFEHSFHASERVVVAHATRVNAVWSTSKPIEVEAPALCRLAEVDLPRHAEKVPAVPPARLRLVTPFDPCGWDATTVYHAAKHGRRGFRLAGATCQAAHELCTDVCMTTTEGPGKPSRWGIAFVSVRYWGRTWLASSSVSPTGTIRSTRTVADVASWGTRAEAEGWMLRAGLDPAKPVPIGAGSIYPAVAEVPNEIPGWGIEFDLGPTGVVGALPSMPDALRPEPVAVPPWFGPEEFPTPEPVAAKPKRRSRELVGQLAFDFA